MENAKRILIFWGVIFVLLLVPTEVATHLLGGYEFAPRHPFGLFALLGLLAVAYSVLPNRLARMLIAVVVICALFVRLLYMGVVHYSGAGFTHEFFIHLEMESVKVAWTEYRWLLLATAAGLLTAGALCMVAARRLPRLATGPAVIALAVCLTTLGWARAAMPEWQLLRSAQRWYAPVNIELDAETLAAWRDSNIVNVDLVQRRRLKASAPETPTNLVLIYLESIGRSLVTHPQHKQLMPYLGQLIEENGLVPWLHHSSYITIEGIVNSQCGTLFGFERGSEALLGYEGMAEELPCLGDVLRKAGYRQVYLGGADLGFAGKGTFLSAHGYDVTKGQMYWAEQGIHQRPGTWGVSDADLFDLAIEEIADLRAQGRPFNLTLLTIGTHLPGYAYEECRPYGEGQDRFLNAVHCTDQLLERFVQRLRDDGQLDDTLVVITADHHIFPSPGMRGVFGDSAVEDRRLPLVVLGANDARAAVDVGAGYDLAPTVLDLLKIEHNANFALGRSLLRPEAHRRYFPTRYEDVVDGVVQHPPQADCKFGSSRQPRFRPPLDVCAKSEMMSVLRHLNAAYSAPPLVLACDAPAHTRIVVPYDPQQPIEFVVAGSDVSGSFLRMARPVLPSSRGLYLMAIDGDGQVIERSFASAKEDAEGLAAAPDPTGHQVWLVAWRDDDEQPAGLPRWVQGTAESPRSGAWLIEPSSRRVITTGYANATGIELQISSEACFDLFAAL